MRRLSIPLTLALAALFTSASALAAGKKLTLAIFLPTTIGDGQERFAYGEKLAKALSDSLGEPVTAKNFGRIEDFTTAASRGQVDLAIVDGWVSLQLPANFHAVAFAKEKSAAPDHWALIARTKTPVKNLIGKRLVVPKGNHNAEQKFVGNLIFQGDLDAKQFKLISVPNVESALKMIEAKSAEAALVPTSQVPKEDHVLYTSQRLPGAVAVAAGSDAERMKDALAKIGALSPFVGFSPAVDDDLNGLKTLLAKGPSKRQPLMASSPILRLDTGRLLKFDEVGRVLPSFTKFVEVPNEQPDP